MIKSYILIVLEFYITIIIPPADRECSETPGKLRLNEFTVGFPVLPTFFLSFKTNVTVCSYSVRQGWLGWILICMLLN